MAIPVVTVSWLDCVEIAGTVLEMVAVTFTEVATVPALTTVCTLPFTSLMALAEVSVIPPVLVFSAKFTMAPDTGPLEESSTWNTTVELSGREASPVPLSAILVGVADTKEIEPIVAAATVTVPAAESGLALTVEVAVTTSAPLQPLATYVTVAIPVFVVTELVLLVTPLTWIWAVPAAMQFELKPIVADPVKSVPPVWTSEIVRLVLPPADRLPFCTPIWPATKPAPVPLPICTVVDPLLGATTCTLTIAASDPAVTVTTTVRSVESPAVIRVAVAVPVASVTAGEPWTPPELAAKVTGIPASSALLASRAYAVMVAFCEPSEGIEATSEVAVSVAAAAPPPPPPPPPPVPLPHPLPKELPQLLPPPQEARARAARAVNQRRLRILIT